MAYTRCGIALPKTHTATKIDVAKTPLATFQSNVSGLYLPEILAYIQATQAGSGDPSPSNPRTISGVSSVDTTVCGKNMWDKTGNDVINAYIANNKIISNANAKTVFIKCKPNTAYTVSKMAGARFSVGYSRLYPSIDDDVYGVINDYTATSITVTTDGTAKYIVAFVFNSSSDTNSWDDIKATIQIEESNTATTYQPYTGQTATTALGGTYYGGYLNVTTGLLTITRIYYNLADLTYTTTSWGAYRSSTLADDIKYAAPSEAICDIYNFVSYATLNQQKPNNSFALSSNYIYVLADTSPVGNVCYNLLNPRTVQLTPAQIEQLLGQNNVFCSSGDVAVYWKID